MSDKTESRVLIQVQDLKKSFDKGTVHALNGVTTDIKRGEVVFVVGPSGSGKSTFLRCLNRLEDPTSGRIIFDGADLMDAKTDINRHRQKMGMVFQHFNLFPHMTVLKNMTLAPMKLQKRSKEDAEKQAMELLERVGLADRAMAYPNQLSGGQKQRIAIVRALCMNPEVMLFDEPTSALDPEMVGIGPFIPHKDTPFAEERGGTLEDTLFYLALLRLMLPHVLLPATTALGTIHPEGREMGVLSGANVVMPNLSPISVRKKYMLYDGKICTGDESAQCRSCLSGRMKQIGCEIVTDRGDYRKSEE